MEGLLITLKIYRHVCLRAATLAARNWPVLATIFIYLAILKIAGNLSARLGIAGGFIFSLVFAACLGSFLYLVEMIVRTYKVSLNDFRNSFGQYLWEVVGVLFIFWILGLIAPAILQLPQGEVILLFLRLAIFVLFNAVPELIYMGHYSPVALLAESYQFIAENWIEWFPATLIAAVIIGVIILLPARGLAVYLQNAALGLALYFTMIMRGLLFLELHGSTHRGRAFKYRMGEWGGG